MGGRRDLEYGGVLDEENPGFAYNEAFNRYSDHHYTVDLDQVDEALLRAFPHQGY